jgi:cytochrome c553
LANYPTQIKEMPTAHLRQSVASIQFLDSMKRTALPFLLAFCIAFSAQAQNLEKGKEINTTCAGCHGEFGQGGSKGEYPRLAGQRVGYIVDQLKSFRSRTRVNIPMYPYTQERELPDGDIKDVAAYLASIELPTTWPVFKDSDDALTRLTLTERVMNHSAGKRQSGQWRSRVPEEMRHLPRQGWQGSRHVSHAGRPIHQLPQAPGR